MEIIFENFSDLAIFSGWFVLGYSRERTNNLQLEKNN